MAVFDTVQTRFAGEDNERPDPRETSGYHMAHRPVIKVLCNRCLSAMWLRALVLEPRKGSSRASGHTSHTMHPLDASA